MKKLFANVLAHLALKVTDVSANTACAYFAYQPKLPDGAKKLRKF